MSQHYSNPERQSDPHALPDLEVFELTAREVAERDEDMVFEYMRRHEFRLASMNSRAREAMFDAMIEEEGIHGSIGIASLVACPIPMLSDPSSHGKKPSKQRKMTLQNNTTHTHKELQP